MAHDKKPDARMTSGEKSAEKKKKHLENLAKSNPELAAANKAKSDAKRERRKASGSTKAFK
jgi:hypothetical protein